MIDEERTAFAQDLLNLLGKNKMQGGSITLLDADGDIITYSIKMPDNDGLYTVLEQVLSTGKKQHTYSHRDSRIHKLKPFIGEMPY